MLSKIQPISHSPTKSSTDIDIFSINLLISQPLFPYEVYEHVLNEREGCGSTRPRQHFAADVLPAVGVARASGPANEVGFCVPRVADLALQQVGAYLGYIGHHYIK